MKIQRRRFMKNRKTPNKTAGWTPHVLDELDAATLRQKTIDRGVFIRPTDKSPEAIAIRKRVAKLGKIMRLENEACGEDGW